MVLVPTATAQATGYDRARKQEIGNKDFELETVDEVYTTRTDSPFATAFSIGSPFAERANTQQYGPIFLGP